MSDKPNCQTCYHWRPANDNAAMAACQRYPQSITTGKGYGCGEWTSKSYIQLKKEHVSKFKLSEPTGIETVSNQMMGDPPIQKKARKDVDTIPKKRGRPPNRR